MDGLSWGAVVAIVAFCCSLCSIASFVIGRRKVAQDEGKEEGSLKTDLQYIKETVRDNAKSVDALSCKIEAQSIQREKEYRDMLVQSTELSVKYDLLSADVVGIKKEIAQYHHH
jgi:hypothetical protein